MSVEVDTQATDDQLRQKIELNEPAATKEPAADGNHAAAEPAAEPAAPAAADEKKEEAPAPKPDEEKKEEEKKCKDKCKEKKEKKDKPADATKLGCAGGLRKLFSFGGKKGKKAKPLDPPATKEAEVPAADQKADAPPAAAEEGAPKAAEPVVPVANPTATTEQSAPAAE